MDRRGSRPGAGRCGRPSAFCVPRASQVRLSRGPEYLMRASSAAASSSSARSEIPASGSSGRRRGRRRRSWRSIRATPGRNGRGEGLRKRACRPGGARATTSCASTVSSCPSDAMPSLTISSTRPPPRSSPTFGPRATPGSSEIRRSGTRRRAASAKGSSSACSAPTIDVDGSLEADVLELRQDRRLVSDEDEDAAVERKRVSRDRVQRGRVEHRLRGEVLTEGFERRAELDVARGGREDPREAREGLHGGVLDDVARLPGLLRRDVAAREPRELGEELLERSAGHFRGDVRAGAERAERATESEPGARPIRVAVLLPEVLVQAAREAAAEDRAEETKLRACRIGELRRGRGEAHDCLRRLGAIHEENPWPADRERRGRGKRDRGRARTLGLPVAESLLERRLRLGDGKAARDHEGRQVRTDESRALGFHTVERDRLEGRRRSVDRPGIGMPVAIERAAHDARGNLVGPLVGLGEIVEREPFHACEVLLLEPRPAHGVREEGGAFREIAREDRHPRFQRVVARRCRELSAQRGDGLAEPERVQVARALVEHLGGHRGEARVVAVRGRQRAARLENERGGGERQVGRAPELHGDSVREREAFGCRRAERGWRAVLRTRVARAGGAPRLLGEDSEEDACVLRDHAPRGLEDGRFRRVAIPVEIPLEAVRLAPEELVLVHEVRPRLEALQRLETRADFMNQYEFFWGEPNSFQRDLDRYRNATKAAVLETARRVITQNARVLFRVLPEQPRRSPGPRDARPKEGVPAAFRPPAPERFTLSNGIPVQFWSTPNLPLTAAALVFQTGGPLTAADGGDAGLASMTAGMLDEGAGDLDALRFGEAVAALGGQFSASASHDALEARMTILSRNFAKGASLLADAVRRPRLEEKDFARVKRLALDDLAQSDERPDEVAARVVNRALYGEGHPYAWPVDGTPASVEAITLERVKAERTLLVRPDLATLLVAGSLSAAETKAALEKAFGDWKAEGPRPPAVSLPAASSLTIRGPRVFLVDRPEAPQTVVRLSLIHISEPTRR